jgi:hypothetical protein
VTPPFVSPSVVFVMGLSHCGEPSPYGIRSTTGE